MVNIVILGFNGVGKTTIIKKLIVFWIENSMQYLSDQGSGTDFYVRKIEILNKKIKLKVVKWFSAILHDRLNFTQLLYRYTRKQIA